MHEPRLPIANSKNSSAILYATYVLSSLVLFIWTYLLIPCGTLFYLRDFKNSLPEISTSLYLQNTYPMTRSVPYLLFLAALVSNIATLLGFFAPFADIVTPFLLIVMFYVYTCNTPEYYTIFPYWQVVDTILPRNTVPELISHAVIACVLRLALGPSPWALDWRVLRSISNRRQRGALMEAVGPEQSLTGLSGWRVPYTAIQAWVLTGNFPLLVHPGEGGTDAMFQARDERAGVRAWAQAAPRRKLYDVLEWCGQYVEDGEAMEMDEEGEDQRQDIVREARNGVGEAHREESATRTRSLAPKKSTEQREFEEKDDKRLERDRPTPVTSVQLHTVPAMRDKARQEMHEDMDAAQREDDDLAEWLLSDTEEDANNGEGVANEDQIQATLFAESGFDEEGREELPERAVTDIEKSDKAMEDRIPALKIAFGRNYDVFGGEPQLLESPALFDIANAASFPPSAASASGVQLLPSVVSVDWAPAVLECLDGTIMNGYRYHNTLTFLDDSMITPKTLIHAISRQVAHAYAHLQTSYDPYHSLGRYLRGVSVSSGLEAAAQLLWEGFAAESRRVALMSRTGTVVDAIVFGRYESPQPRVTVTEDIHTGHRRQSSVLHAIFGGRDAVKTTPIFI